LEVIADSPVTYSFDTMQAVLDSVATVLGYHEYFDYLNQTALQKSERLALARGVLQTYCGVVSSAMVENQHPFESIKARIRVMSTLISSEIAHGSGDSGNASLVELGFTVSEQEAYNDVQTSAISLAPPFEGGWCLMSLDTIVFSDIDHGSLKSNALSVLSVGQEATDAGSRSSSRRVSDSAGDLFLLSMEDVADIALVSSLPRMSHNVSCSPVEFGTYLQHACPHNVTHELLCDKDSTGVWEVTCPAVMINMTCKSIRQEASAMSVDDDSGCVLKSMTDRSVVCECPTSALHSQSHISESGRHNATAGEDGDEVVQVEFAAMLDYVVEDFVSTWSSAGDLSIDELDKSNAALIALVSVMLFVVLGLWTSNDTDKKDEAEGLRHIRRAKRRQLLQKRVTPSRDEEAAQQKAVVNMDVLFPQVPRPPSQ
jgi:hypothetical protein